MELRNTPYIEQTWQATLRSAADHWRAGRQASSIQLQLEALGWIESSHNTWALLWSYTQLGLCQALVGETEQARQLLARATTTAHGLGQTVVAGICATTEALCALFPNRGHLPAEARRSLCHLQGGLLEYLEFHRPPLAVVCWSVAGALPQELRPPRVRRPAAPTSGPEVRVTLLGTFGIAVAGQPLSGLPNGRGGAILRYLLAHYGQQIHGDVLLEQFWPDVDPEVSRNRFHYTMHCLRRALAATAGEGAGLQIVCNEGRYGFPANPSVWIDSTVFRDMALSGRQAEQRGQPEQAIEIYRSALLLYGGEFLSEERYEDWAETLRAPLNDLYLDTIDRLSQLSLSRGDHQTALQYGHQLLEQDSCREDIHQRLMHCYVALGQRSRALRQYERCAQALDHELGVQPLPETKKLYQQIKYAYDRVGELMPI